MHLTVQSCKGTNFVIATCSAAPIYLKFQAGQNRLRAFFNMPYAWFQGWVWLPESDMHDDLGHGGHLPAQPAPAAQQAAVDSTTVGHAAAVQQVVNSIGASRCDGARSKLSHNVQATLHHIRSLAEHQQQKEHCSPAAASQSSSSSTASQQPSSAVQLHAPQAPADSGLRLPNDEDEAAEPAPKRRRAFGWKDQEARCIAHRMVTGKPRLDPIPLPNIGQTVPWDGPRLDARERKYLQILMELSSRMVVRLRENISAQLPTSHGRFGGIEEPDDLWEETANIYRSEQTAEHHRKVHNLSPGLASLAD